MDMPSAWISAGEPLTIVSFDRSPHEAEREKDEDRSLNLALRRRRVRSEVLRIPLDASATVKAFLADVIAALAGRRILIVVRDLARDPDTIVLLEQLCELAGEVLVFFVGEKSATFSHPSALVFELENDERETIERLADALVRTEAA
jgi:hypothetical protein